MMFYKNKLIWVIALISGVSVQLNWLSQATLLMGISQFEAISRIVLGPILVWFVMNVLDYVINLLVSNWFSCQVAVIYYFFSIYYLALFGVIYRSSFLMVAEYSNFILIWILLIIYIFCNFVIYIYIYIFEINY